MPGPLPRLAPARRATAGTFSARIFQAPRENQRTLARLLRTGDGQLPAHLKPKELKTIHLQARSLHLARRALEGKLKEKGYRVRSINRGHRSFIVYISHPEDGPHVSSDS